MDAHLTEPATAVRYETEPSQVGSVTVAVSGLQGQIEQLGVHIDELRARLGLVLSSDESPGTIEAEGNAGPRRSPSQLALDIAECSERVQRMRYAISSMHDRVDL